MTTTIVNDALVKLDNVVTASNYILEELQTRKEQLITHENILDQVKVQMNSTEFKYDILWHIRNNYLRTISREVAFSVMEQIDNDIEKFINNRVSKALEAAGVSSSSQSSD